MRRLISLDFGGNPEKIRKFFPEVGLKLLTVDGIFQSSVGGLLLLEITVNDLCGGGTVAADLDIPDKKENRNRRADRRENPLQTLSGAGSGKARMEGRAF